MQNLKVKGEKKLLNLLGLSSSKKQMKLKNSFQRSKVLYKINDETNSKTSHRVENFLDFLSIKIIKILMRFLKSHSKNIFECLSDMELLNATEGKQ